MVFGLPLAVPEEGNSEALHKLHEALSIRDDIDTNSQSPSVIPNTWSSEQALTDESPDGNAGNIFKQLPPEGEGAPPLPNVPSSGSSLLAQAFTGDTPGGGAVEIGVSAAAAAYAAFLQRLGDLHQVFKDDHPDVMVKDIPLVENPKEKSQAGATPRVATPGVQQNPATVKGGTDSGNLCPEEIMETRALPWCDYGFPGSVFRTPNVVGRQRRWTILVRGYTCTLFPQ